MSPLVGEEGQRRHIPSLFLMSQCLDIKSDLKRPERRAVVATVLLTSYGLALQEVKIGWGFVRDMKSGLKKVSDERREACPLNVFSQKFMTEDLTRALNCDFGGGSWRRLRGLGS